MLKMVRSFLFIPFLTSFFQLIFAHLTIVLSLEWDHFLQLALRLTISMWSTKNALPHVQVIHIHLWNQLFPFVVRYFHLISYLTSLQFLALQERTLLATLVKVNLSHQLFIHLFDKVCPEDCAKCDVNECKTCNNGYQLNTKKECVLKPTITEESSGLSGNE